MRPVKLARHPRRSAFTLIELLIVMSIIIVLAGLILATSGYMQKKGYRSRAEAEIAAMSAALESYKADNGIYPTDSVTNALNPTGTDTSTYRTASVVLYRALSGDDDNGTDRVSESKTYFSFKPNQLGPVVPPQAKVDYIRDPFGNSYGYSTMKASNPAASAGYNPTFDLWSTCGSTDAAQWVKNW
ncbi:MAG: prepilin-type N-terminal cleavage/methylation domain-containing protein [Chthoniobacterales bacterium]